MLDNINFAAWIALSRLAQNFFVLMFVILVLIRGQYLVGTALVMLGFFLDRFANGKYVARPHASFDSHGAVSSFLELNLSKRESNNWLLQGRVLTTFLVATAFQCCAAALLFNFHAHVDLLVSRWIDFFQAPITLIVSNKNIAYEDHESALVIHHLLCFTASVATMVYSARLIRLDPRHHALGYDDPAFKLDAAPFALAMIFVLALLFFMFFVGVTFDKAYVRFLGMRFSPAAYSYTQAIVGSVGFSILYLAVAAYPNQAQVLARLCKKS